MFFLLPQYRRVSFRARSSSRRTRTPSSASTCSLSASPTANRRRRSVGSGYCSAAVQCNAVQSSVHCLTASCASYSTSNHERCAVLQTDYGDRELSMQPKYYQDYLTGELQIKELSTTDDATYQCRAINRVGDARGSLKLVVYGTCTCTFTWTCTCSPRNLDRLQN